MSFQQGLSGLNAAAKSLDVIGNNIANSSTVGFKGAQAQFADVYANSLNGASGLVAGIGTKVAKIAQQFTQGPIESSSNPLDMAINGAGFFRMELDGVVQLSRNGQFELDENGSIINAQGAKLTGYMADTSGTLSTGTPIPLKINTADLPPVSTTEARYTMKLDSNSQVPQVAFDAANPKSYNFTTPMDNFDSLGNKHVMQTYYVKSGPGTWDVYASADGTEINKVKAQEAAFNALTANPAATDNDLVVAAWSGVLQKIADLTADAATRHNDAATLSATDPLAAAEMEAEAVKVDNYVIALQATYDGAIGLVVSPSPEELAVGAARGLIGAKPEDVAAAAAASVPGMKIGTVIFNAVGELDLSRMALRTPAQGLPFNVGIPVYPSTGAVSPFNVKINFDRLQQFASKAAPSGNDWFAGESSVTAKTQNGYRAGQLTRFSTGVDGVMLGEYNNGEAHILGQVVFANVANPNGLTSLGNNAWAESASSGQILIGTPDNGTFGILQASAVESSNVDLTQELVNMITAQRAYQANAQTIKTQDQVMQTLVNLR
jgi:flagellar hook protein FlgE